MPWRIRTWLIEEVETPPFPSGSLILDVRHRMEWAVQQNSGCHPEVDAAPDVSGGSGGSGVSRILDVIHSDGNGGSWMEFLPGWSSYPDGIPTRMAFLPGWNSYPDGNELDVVVLRRPYLPHFRSNSYTV